eukprot:s351_g31.t1
MARAELGGRPMLTWKNLQWWGEEEEEVAHYVDLREEDDEEEWAKVLAHGAQATRGTQTRHGGTSRLHRCGHSLRALPVGDIRGSRPERWLLQVTAVGQAADPTATTLRPRTGYVLEWDPQRRVWQLGNLVPKAALQCYYDWAFMRGTGQVREAPPRFATFPPGQWEMMAIRLIPKPPTTTNAAAAPQPTPEPDDVGRVYKLEHPQLCQQVLCVAEEE